MPRKDYPSDLTDGQWQVVKNRVRRHSRRGRPPMDRREMINAIWYVNRNGCEWRALPHDIPKWETVYTVFWRWRNDGTWQRIHDRLRERCREAVGKISTPTVAIIDS